MELRQIQYFIQLFKDRNITKASKHLFISQQGLSKSINRLEDELGFPLFKRSASGVTPTREANRLYDYFYKISDSCHELEKEIETMALPLHRARIFFRNIAVSILIRGFIMKKHPIVCFLIISSVTRQILLSCRRRFQENCIPI